MALILATMALALSPIQTANANPAATFTVFLSVDSGGGSLRWAINQSNLTSGPNTINIVSTGTILLLSDLPPINTNVTINGPAGGITIDGGSLYRVFVVGLNKSLTLNHIDITRGYAPTDPGGGAIYLDHGTLNLNDSTLYNNTARSQGGALFNNNGTMNITNSTIRDNHANIELSSVAAAGGGLYSWGGVTTITNSTFSNNGTEGVGGGIFVDGGTVSVTNSTFTGNSATVSAGGNGGAFYVKSGTLNLTNVTVASNSATGTGGIYNNAGAVNLKNTLVASNTVSGNCAGTISDGGGNLSYPDTTCPGTNGNPNLGPLASNGGPTQTMALSAGSAALDKIPNASGCGVGITTDQRNIARPQPPGGLCDIGAYELVRSVAPAASNTNSKPAEVPEADTLLLFGGGMGGLVTWVGWQFRKRRTMK